MAVHVLMLRGINLGPSRRVPMAELRALFTDAGYAGVRTYVQSGNIVLADPADPADRADRADRADPADPADIGDPADPAELERAAARLISERFGFEVPVIARTRDALDAVVALDPLRDVVTEPKRYQVSFCAAEVSPEVVARLQGAAVGDERLVAHGRELYAWHPEGVARSKMWNALAGAGLGTVATARNWTTVTTLLQMADEARS